ncbi:MAG: IPT/TIG domain-containing protein [Acidobacteriaceae bacterium]|jgi:hypothetical protein
MKREKATLGLRPLRPFSVSFRALITLVTSAALWGCGGGGTSSQPPTPPSPDFSLSVSSTKLNVTAGASATTSVTVTASNGFTSSVEIGITGLPSGVTFSPASPEVTPGQSVQLTITAAPYVSPSTNSITVTGAGYDISHNTTISLAVAAYAGNNSLPRTRYTRTDAATPYFLWPNSNWILYDAPTNRFFVTDPSSNQIMALDAATQTQVGTITVPGAYGIDETPDHTTLYAGTQIGDVYAIDPVGMKVVHRYIASEIGANGFRAYSVRVLASGKLALLGGQGGIPGIDGYAGFAIWGPADNSITIYGDGGPSANNCASTTQIFEFALTSDRTTILLSAGNSLCAINTNTGQITGAPVVAFPVIPTPDGTALLALQYGLQAQVLVLDPKTLAQKSSFALPANVYFGTTMFVSPDSTTVYLTGSATESTVYAFNIASGAQVGWLSNLFLETVVGGTGSGPAWSPDFQAMDNTGLLAGPMEEGVGFLDTAALQTSPVGTPFTNTYLNPASGPAAGGTQLQVPSSANLDALYFGKSLASSISEVGNGLFEATTPPGQPGYVDVYGLMTDGSVQIIPEAFSYGPTILEATPNSSTAEGGGAGILYGYGFGSVASNTIPTDLQIMIGGKQAQITSYNPNAYGTEGPPFPLESVSYTIPAGVSGGSADITVTNQAGSATLSAGMSYLPATQQFPLSGAALVQGIYDAKRDLYYFTDAAVIQVFSKAQGQWLTPIQVPAAPTGKTHRLWGIALSPDGSKLAVSDENTAMIYVMSPDPPSSAQSFSLPYYVFGQPISSPGETTVPAGLAISDLGDVYVAAYLIAGNGDGFFKLDTNTGGIVDYGVNSSGAVQYKVAVTTDASKAFFNNAGSVFSVDTATDKVTYASVDDSACCGDYDLTLSPGQTTVEATSSLYDTNLNAESSLTLNDREAQNITYVYGTKLSPDGSLLFQPSTNGIDVYDGRLGILRSRIALPFALSQNYDALVGDGRDDALIAIIGTNGSGIATVDLSSLSEPAPLPYAKDHIGRPQSPATNEPSSHPSVHGSQTTPMPRLVPRSVIKHATNERLGR